MFVIDLSNPAPGAVAKRFVAQLGVVFLTVALMLFGAMMGDCSVASVEPPSPQIETMTVKVQVTVTVTVTVVKSCIAKAPSEPFYRWGADTMPATDKEKVAILLADFEAVRQYGADWVAAAIRW